MAVHRSVLLLVTLTAACGCGADSSGDQCDELIGTWHEEGDFAYYYSLSKVYTFHMETCGAQFIRNYTCAGTHLAAIDPRTGLVAYEATFRIIGDSLELTDDLLTRFLARIATVCEEEEIFCTEPEECVED